MPGLRDDGMDVLPSDPPAIFEGRDLGSGMKDWSTDDLLRQAMFLGLVGADWAQTRTVVKHPESLHENNPLLGAHPSMGTLNAAVLGTMLGHTLLMGALPPEYRRWAQMLSIGGEGANVARNKYFVGLKADF